MKKLHRFVNVLIACCSLNTSYAKQEFNSEQLSFFETKVRPLLNEKCLECGKICKQSSLVEIIKCPFFVSCETTKKI